MPCGAFGGESSPRTWGCFFFISDNPLDLRVFPTHVGVFLPASSFEARGFRLPHARGGVSRHSGCFCVFPRSSPRTWGCFFLGLYPPFLFAVFPTHVGVFLNGGAHGDHFIGLPHARGGVSFFRVFAQGTVPSSPRTWGCFPNHHSGVSSASVFPTHVGVFLLIPQTCPR